MVTVVARPNTPFAWIRLAGDLDLIAEPALTDAAARLHGRDLRFIVIDMTAVTFVCSTFAHFVAALHRGHPDAELVLHHPSGLARFILTLAGMDEFVVSSGRTVPAVTKPRPGGVLPAQQPLLDSATSHADAASPSALRESA